MFIHGHTRLYAAARQLFHTVNEFSHIATKVVLTSCSVLFFDQNFLTLRTLILRHCCPNPLNRLRAINQHTQKAVREQKQHP